MRVFLLLLAVGLTGFASAAPAISIKSFSQDVEGVTFVMNPGVMKIRICEAGIVRVTYSPDQNLPQAKSVSVIREWKPTPFKIEESPEAVTLVTNKLRVVVERENGVVAFLNAAGKMLLQEASGGGKKLTSAVVNQESAFTVEQSFQSPPDEALFGLGQYQDGIWNWRGIPVELRQCNTQIAMPVMVSTKGYGLLWDNASLTEFNPADQEVPLTGGVKTNEPSGPQATEELDAAKPGKQPEKKGDRVGSFTTTGAGEYVFVIRGGDRKGQVGIRVDGRDLVYLKNTWLPYSVSGKISLPADKTVPVKLLGGGPGARLFARPLGNLTTFRSSIGDAIDYYFFYGPRMDDVIAGYRAATGAAPMFPKWAYGFWQCRERYSSQKQILETAEEFRKRRIPVDLIVQDWQYWGRYGWGAHRFDERQYPDPLAMTTKLHDMKIRFMVSAWSNPKTDETHQQLKAINGLVPVDSDLVNKPNPKGQLPQPVWYDAFNPKAREVRWAAMKKGFFDVGTDAWWQDAAEPGDDGNAINNCDVFLGNGNRYRNAYTLFTNRCAYEGQRSATDEKRVCILTRSAYAGQQRYAAASWSGDIRGDWATFRRQIPAGLNFSLTGIPYWTTDTGGFFRPGDQYTSPDFNELLVRWFQMSTFCPILRIHGFKTETEMWKWPLAEKNLLKYNHLRYRLLPYNYSWAWKVTHDHYTPMRALVMDFPDDAKVRRIDDQYMFGPAFLVCPVTKSKAASRKVYLPADAPWTDFWTGRRWEGGKEIDVPAALETLPLFVRAGSIIPVGPELQYTSEKPADPIELRIYAGADGTFTLYEDEGDNYGYEKGRFATIRFDYNESKRTLTIGAREGSFPGMIAKREFRVVIVGEGHGVGDQPTEKPDHLIAYDGKPISVKF